MVTIVEPLEHRFVVPVMRVRFPLVTHKKYKKTSLILAMFLIETKLTPTGIEPLLIIIIFIIKKYILVIFKI